jgi:uncharacterized protein YeeX (DUF496 family)
LCGEEAIRNVILTTSIWDKIQDEVGHRREKELKDRYWKGMLDLGSTTARFQNTYDSAWAIVEGLVDVDRHSLLLQEEMVDLHRKLSETHAAIALQDQLQRFLKEQNEIISKLQEQVETQENAEIIKKLNKQSEQIRRDLRTTLDQMEQLKIPVSRRLFSLLFSPKKSLHQVS